MDWGYTREESSSTRTSFGARRCVITEAEESVSKTSGKPMIVVTVKPNGSGAKISNYIVKNEYFNRNMSKLFDAFPQIGENNFDFATWTGAMGAAEFVLDDRGYNKIRRWIFPKEAEALPAWEGEIPEKQEVTSITDEDELPDIFM